MEHVFVNKEIKRVDKIINYVVHHAYVKIGVYIIAALEATISPVLPEIVVATVLSYRKDISWKLLSLVSALGSVTGVSILYGVGRFLYKTYQTSFDSFFGSGLIAGYTEQLLQGNTFTTMFVASFTPLPDRVFALLSGIYSLNFFVVLVAFFFGRLLRVGIVAYFSYQFGDEARAYITKHTKNAMLIIAGVLLAYTLLKLGGIL